MITIKSSRSADTRSCNYAEVSQDELLLASHRHINDVEMGMHFFARALMEAARLHDCDKITNIEGFYRDFVGGFNDTIWWDNHRKISRHHLAQADGVPADVNLIDVLEHVVDCVMAGMARTGTVYDLHLDNDILQRALKNTVEMLKANVRVDVAEVME